MGIKRSIMWNEALSTIQIQVTFRFCTYQSIGTELTIRAIRSGWKIEQIQIKTMLRKIVQDSDRALKQIGR